MQGARVLLLSLVLGFSMGVQAHDSQAAAAADAKCEKALTAETDTKTEGLTLNSFFAEGEANLAVAHPFTIANAAERSYALIMHKAPREALDPLHKVKKVKVYPTLSGEDPATEGRMVVGQEEAIEQFVEALYSIARGDRAGKSLGFPGPAGTGKTELFYVIANLQRNLSKEAKYKQLSYRFKNLHEIPALKFLFKYDREGKPITNFFDPDLVRSPFTLLRPDMQEEILGKVLPQIRSKWGMTVAKGWTLPEPKSAEVVRVILEHTYPELATGGRTIDDLTREEYISAIQKYLVIVPKTTIRAMPKEPNIIRTQTDNPNYQALFAAPNVTRAAYYGYESPFGVDYNGIVFRQEDIGLFMADELFRQPPEFLNIMLELIQNRIAATDFGRPVQLDIVPVWNSNDESIEKSQADNAIKALLNRTDSPPMRSLLAVNQIEAVMPFQIEIKQFSMRRLNEKDIKPMVHPEVYPPVDAKGVTHSAKGRFALYYNADGQQILISPYALNYMAWLASATRYVTDQNKLAQFANELNLVRANSGLLTDPIERLKVDIGDRDASPADRAELARIRFLLKEGAKGITARHIEPWLKKSLEIARKSGKGALTPAMVDQAFAILIDSDETFKPEKTETRAEWMLIRQRVKLEVLLPKLDQEVTAIVSGDMNKAERLYDEIEQEFIAIDGDPNAKVVTSEDGSGDVGINFPRLDEIRKIYFEKFRKEFSPKFLLRQVSTVRRGSSIKRDSDLLEAVRLFLAHHNSMTATHISALDGLYSGKEQNNPAIQQRANEINSVLADFGYDPASFEDAVRLVAELQRKRLIVQQAQQERAQ